MVEADFRSKAADSSCKLSKQRKFNLYRLSWFPPFTYIDGLASSRSYLKNLYGGCIDLRCSSCFYRAVFFTKEKFKMRSIRTAVTRVPS